MIEARDALSIRPQTVEEIGDVNAKHADLSRRKPEIEPLFAEAERKNKLLRSVAGGGVEQVGELRTRWDKFEIMMESHQLMIKDQVRKYRTSSKNSALLIIWHPLLKDWRIENSL